MRVVVLSTKPNDEQFVRAANQEVGHDLGLLEARLTPETARLAQGVLRHAILTPE